MFYNRQDVTHFISLPSSQLTWHQNTFPEQAFKQFTRTRCLHFGKELLVTSEYAKAVGMTIDPVYTDT